GPSLVFMGRRTGFLTGEADPFLPDDEARVSHNILDGLCHPETQRRLDGLSLSKLANFHDVFAFKIMMSSHMLNKEVRSLSAEVLRIHSEIVDLRNKRADSAIVISRLEAKLLDVK
ncbi:hypothetical protein Tco_0362412, partial [Tanacetum coccineum]